MKTGLMALTAILAVISCSTPKNEWAPAGENIKTKWAAEVGPLNSHPEYPRPQMVRSDWKCLNGLWNYAISPIDALQMPEADGNILVPFAVESSLSGVGKSVTKDDALWYKTTFKIPSSWKKKRVILHFDGVDWKTQPSINGSQLPEHTGCYTAFEYDITDLLKKFGRQELVLKVTDATDDGDFQPRGKQVMSPKGIWYTPVTGIWKSVWLEPVSEASISDYNVESDIDQSELSVEVNADGIKTGDIINIELLEGGVGYSPFAPSSNIVASAQLTAETDSESAFEAILRVEDIKLWSPDEPYLYGLRLSIIRDGKVQDTIDGYTAMRKISIIEDNAGVKRMALNNEPLFHYGPLDQGWWPDGLYTAPTLEAMEFDIEQTKAHGFNMIRKHIKVEPFTWFYACDRLGLLVWQDMPSFADNTSGEWEFHKYATSELDFKATDEAKANYYKEWGEIMCQVKKFQSIVVWVPFNEHWGQFDTPEVIAFTYAHDDTRLVNMASGGNWIEGVGDILDSHHYPTPFIHIWNPDQVVVLGEYGGIGLPVDGHTWEINRKWGYIQLNDSKVVTDKYVEYAEELIPLVKKGCSAAVYTQTTDVEGEVNGLMTYDREVVKLDVKRIKEANEKVIASMCD